MGGCRCTFRTCNVSTQKFPQMSFFHYPISKKDRLEKWTQYANYAMIKNLATSQARNRAVCGLHFKDECFMNYKKNRLTPTAIPTLDRLKSGKVLDYSLAENPKPSALPPTKDEHLIPPKGVLIWGQAPEFWSSYSTVSVQFNNRTNPTRLSDSTQEPATKKLKTIDAPDTPRILNKGIRLITNVPLNGNFEIDESTISLTDEVFQVPDDDDDDDPTEVDDCNIDLPTTNSCHVTNLDDMQVPNGDAILSIEDVEYLSVDRLDSIEDSLLTKSALDAACSTYEDEINLLKKEMETREQTDQKEIADLKEELEKTKTKLQQSGETAATWKSIASEFEERLADLETKNQELLAAKAAESAPATPKPAVSSTSLTKPQLFNGIKKYLSASMTALVRMEMFGSSERQWKPDEKQVSVELLKLGEEVYKYFRDEWRFRLPPKKMVEQWTHEVAEEDIDDL